MRMMPHDWKKIKELFEVARFWRNCGLLRRYVSIFSMWRRVNQAREGFPSDASLVGLIELRNADDPRLSGAIETSRSDIWMTPDDWNRVKELFEAALDLQPPQRAVFLAQHCPDEQTR